MGYPLLKEIPLNLTFLNFDQKNGIAFNFTRKSLLNAARARLARGLYKKFPIKCSTCKTRQVVNLKGNPYKIFPPASIFQRNPLKNFFHLIFFQKLSPKIKTHLQFYMKISCIFFPFISNREIPLKFFDFQKSGEFYKRNPFKIFSEKKSTLKFCLKNTLYDRQVRHHFFQKLSPRGCF